MSVPASSTQTIRWSSTCPVSVSTSTTAMCVPNGKVGFPLNSFAAFSSSSRPSLSARVASSSQDRDGSAVPATWKRPSPLSRTMSCGFASR